MTHLWCNNFILCYDICLLECFKNGNLAISGNRVVWCWSVWVQQHPQFLSQPQQKHSNMSPVLKNCNITKRHRKLQSWNNLSLGILLCQTSGVQNKFVSCVRNRIQGLLWSGFKGEVEVGDLVLEETENPLGDGGCTIVTDVAIPFTLFFACSVTFNILVSAGAWELPTQSPLSRRVWHYTLFHFNDVIKK